MNWHESLVADKHCIGIPGNRTSMLIVPIVARGMLIPKTSSRATSPAGTGHHGNTG
jgi:thymidine phosphorylase